MQFREEEVVWEVGKVKFQKNIAFCQWSGSIALLSHFAKCKNWKCEKTNMAQNA